MYNDSQSWLAFTTHDNKCSLYSAIRVLKIATDRDLLHTISIVFTELVVYIMTCSQQHNITVHCLAAQLPLILRYNASINYNYRTTYKILREPRMARVNSICASTTRAMALARAK